MRVHTYLSPHEVDPGVVAEASAVVIDVLRATSTIVEAFSAGARAIYPTQSSEEAVRLANSLGREDTLLCGERKGLKIEGFDLGNSPLEFTPERVGGKRLVMNTTNGTRAFLTVEAAESVVAGSLLNLSAVSRSLAGSERIVLVCGGKEDRFSLDDALCAGLILQRLSEENGSDGPREWRLDDASRAVLALADQYPVDADVLGHTAAGAALVDIGLEADVVHCATVDRSGLVPEMHDRTIRLPEPL